MKNLRSVFSIFAILVLVPNLAYASWWNPFTWFSYNTTVNIVKSENLPKSAGSNLEVSTTTQVIMDEQLKSEEIVTTNKNNLNSNFDTQNYKTNPVPKPKDLPLVVKSSFIAPTTENVKVTNAKFTNPTKLAIEQLLKDPTYENFKSFCNQSKYLPGYSLKNVLNDTRDQMTSTTTRLYDEVELKWCRNIDIKKNFIIYNLPDENLYIALNQNDIDQVREVKIIYNDNLKKFSQTSKFVIYANPLEGAKRPPLGVDMSSMVSISNYFLNQIEQYSLSNDKHAIITVKSAQRNLTSILFDPIIEIKKLHENK